MVPSLDFSKISTPTDKNMPKLPEFNLNLKQTAPGEDPKNKKYEITGIEQIKE
jgi:hypothetical protein